MSVYAAIILKKTLGIALANKSPVTPSLKTTIRSKFRLMATAKYKRLLMEYPFASCLI